MRKSAMISDFSSTLNGTLIIPPLCLDSRETSHSHYSMQHDRSPAIHLLWVFLIVVVGGESERQGCPIGIHLRSYVSHSELLNCNLCANLGHFLRDLLCFCLFQAKTCNLTYNFDDVDLVWANL